MNKIATKYISFFIVDTYYAMPLSFIGAFIKYDNLLPVPKASDIVKGLTYQNGKIITVVDSAKLLGLLSHNNFDICLSFFINEETFALPVTEGGETVKSSQVFTDRKKNKFKKYIKINKNKFYILFPEDILKEISL